MRTREDVARQGAGRADGTVERTQDGGVGVGVHMTGSWQPETATRP